MLYLMHHLGWRAQVKLLDSVMSSQREEAGAWAIYSQAPDILGRGNDIVRDPFAPHIPQDGLAGNGVSQFALSAKMSIRQLTLPSTGLCGRFWTNPSSMARRSNSLSFLGIAPPWLGLRCYTPWERSTHANLPH